MEQGIITHEIVWQYLERFAPYLSEEELGTLSDLFTLMGQDYTPIQLFGTDTLSFALEKELRPYVNQEIPTFTPTHREAFEKESAARMLESFNQAAKHMETNELYCILVLLSMMDQNNLTIALRASQDGNGTQVLDCYQKEKEPYHHKF